MKYLWILVVAVAMVQARPEMEHNTTVDQTSSAVLSTPKCIGNFQHCRRLWQAPCCSDEDGIMNSTKGDQYICDLFNTGLCQPTNMIGDLDKLLSLKKQLNNDNYEELRTDYAIYVQSKLLRLEEELNETKSALQTPDGQNAGQTITIDRNTLLTGTLSIEVHQARDPATSNGQAECIRNYNPCRFSATPCCERATIEDGTLHGPKQFFCFVFGDICQPLGETKNLPLYVQLIDGIHEANFEDRRDQYFRSITTIPDESP